MTYQTMNPYDEHKKGKLIFTYGPTGVGQTTSWLISLPEPILYMTGEYRDQHEALEAIEEIEDRKIEFHGGFSYFDDVNDLLNALHGQLLLKEVNYKSAIFDGWSVFMNVSTGGKLEDDYYDSRVKDKDGKIDDSKIKRKFGEKVSRDPALYQHLASYMLRAFQMLRNLSTKFGIPVVVTAHSKEVNRYKRLLTQAGQTQKIEDPRFRQVVSGLNIDEDFFDTYTLPAFDGKMFLFNFGGLPDYIGLVGDHFNKQGKLVYPPEVRFKRHADYLSKWTGRKLKKDTLPLDYRKIFK